MLAKMCLRVYGVIGEETGGGWRMVDPVGLRACMFVVEEGGTHGWCSFVPAKRWETRVCGFEGGIDVQGRIRGTLRLNLRAC